MIGDISSVRSANPGEMSEAPEVKQEATIEAAVNTQTKAAAEAAEQNIVEASRNAGVTAFNFDADASVEEKRAATRAVSSHLCILAERAHPRMGRFLGHHG